MQEHRFTGKVDKANKTRCRVRVEGFIPRARICQWGVITVSHTADLSL